MLEDGFQEITDEDRLIPRDRRIALILLGILAAGAGILFGLYQTLSLGVIYAHWSNPTAEFRAAGDARMMLAFLLFAFGIACLFTRRKKHWLVVGVLAVAVVINAGIAIWLEELSDQSVEDLRGTPIIVDPTPLPPTVPVNSAN